MTFSLRLRQFPTIFEMVLNIVLLFCTMYYAKVYSCIEDYKIKISISSEKNTECALHSVVSKFSQNLTLMQR